jgi:hydrogenase nickel incorporation protein HypB
MEIKVLKDILGANEQIAERNRELLDKSGVFAIDVMSSPGAGKTSLILETIKQLKGETRIGVIEGDVSSSVDAEIIGSEGVPVLQINTGGECHLDASMTSRALADMPLQDIDLLFIENVGNLICPSEFALGAHRRILISSTPEGDDKPLKYPLMFTVADAVLINKMDLLPHVKFDTMAYSKAVKNLNDRAEIIEVSCASGQGIDQWITWLQNHMRHR